MELILKSNNKESIAKIVGSSGILGGRWSLSINISQSKKEKSGISNSSGSSPKSFDLSIERLYRSIGASIVKEVQDIFIMALYTLPPY